MIKGLSRAGVGDVGSIENFIQQAAAQGFGAIDSGGSELIEWINTAGVESAQAFLAKHNVVIGSIGLSVEWRTTEEAFQAGLKQLVEDAAAAAKLGVTACCTYVLPSTDLKAAHFMVLATRRLKTCAQILSAYGIRLGLEFVGPHHLRTNWANPFLWTMEETLDWIAAIGEPNVGLLLDAYHWYTNEGNEEELLRLQPSQIVHVHINDAKPVAVADVLDNDRIYPGEGVIDLGIFLSALKRIGYTGVVAQEILSQEASTASSAELIERSAAGYTKVYTAAGLA
ncbi:sugar phosphate isomerase/epimerase [Paenibacillaceae bacterium]|nr:sugar phosphate isomerase/epimerase [Paenibacillaceae bacterium]